MKYKAINIQHFLIAGMLVCACNVFAQKQSSFSAQFSFSSKTHFDKTPYQNNWFGAISVSSNAKVFFTPKKSRFSFSAGAGQTQWRSHLKYDDDELKFRTNAKQGVSYTHNILKLISKNQRVNSFKFLFIQKKSHYANDQLR